MDKASEAEFWKQRKEKLLSREKMGFSPETTKTDVDTESDTLQVAESVESPEQSGVVSEESVEAEAAPPQAEQQTAPDKRRHERYSVRFPVYVRCSDGEVIRATAVNLSYSGIYLEYPAPADKDAAFDMMFDLRVADEEHRIFVRARLIRCVFVGGKDCYGLAFEFQTFGKASQPYLDTYIRYREQKLYNNNFF